MSADSTVRFLIKMTMIIIIRIAYFSFDGKIITAYNVKLSNGAGQFIKCIVQTITE